MKKEIIIITSILVVVFSCLNASKMKNQEWETIKANGINEENKVFDFLFFLNRKNGIMFGSAYSDEDLLKRRFEEFKAVIYYTTNTGTTWNKRELGKGRFTSCVAKSNLIFAATEHKEMSRGNQTVTDSSKIYFSKDSGNHWIVFSVLKDFYIRNLFIESENEIYVIGKSANNVFWTLKMTINHGNTWTDVTELPNNMTYPLIIKRTLFYLSKNTQNHVITKSLLGNLTKLDVFKTQFVPIIINQVDGNLLAIGMLNKRIAIYKFDFSTHKFVFLSSVDIANKFPIDFYYYNNKIMLLLGEQNQIGVTYTVYYKNSTDTDWNESSVPSSYFKPYTFVENQIWGYSYGKFYRKTIN